MKHTPTPWTQGQGPYVQAVSKAGGCTVASCDTFTANSILTREEIDANAAHIVRCVNCFEELLAELKGALRIFERDQVKARPEQYARIRAAIAKASQP